MTDKKSVEAVNSIIEMVQAYNAAEADQVERLRDLLGAMKARKGYRKIRFANGELWANCWNNPNEFDYKLNLERSDRQIVEVIPGD